MKVWCGQIDDYLSDLNAIKESHDFFVVQGLTDRKLVFQKKSLKDNAFEGKEVEVVLVWDEELL